VGSPYFGHNSHTAHRCMIELMNRLTRAAIVMGGLIAVATGQMVPEAAAEIHRLDRSDIGNPATLFKAQANLAVISFSFLAAKHVRSGALGPEDIEILEDGVPRTVALLEGGASLRTIPSDVILLFDSTPRFRPYLNADMLKPSLLDELENVRISIYGFADSVYRLIKPSRNMEEIQKAMRALLSIPAGASAIDPVIQTMRDATSDPGGRPRMMILFSGAADLSCQIPIASQETIRSARELGIALYPVAVQPQPGGIVDSSISGHEAIRHPVPPSRSFAPTKRFLDLGPATGGKSFARFTTPGDILQEVFQHVSAQSRGEYTAGFYLTASQDPKSHSVQVVLKDKRQGDILGGARTLVH